MTAAAVSPNTAPLQDTLVAIYRSFGQYLRDTMDYSRFVQLPLHSLIDRQFKDAGQLAEWLIGQTGTVYTGVYSLDYSDVHFLDDRRLAAKWLDYEQPVLQKLEQCAAKVASADPGRPLIDQVLKNERELIAELRKLHAA